MRRSPAAWACRAMRDELEDLAFRHLMPEARAMIVARLDDLRARNGKIIGRIEKELAEELAARGIEAEVKGREKRPIRCFARWSAIRSPSNSSPIFSAFASS